MITKRQYKAEGGGGCGRCSWMTAVLEETGWELRKGLPSAQHPPTPPLPLDAIDPQGLAWRNRPGGILMALRHLWFWCPSSPCCECCWVPGTSSSHWQCPQGNRCHAGSRQVGHRLVSACVPRAGRLAYGELGWIRWLEVMVAVPGTAPCHLSGCSPPQGRHCCRWKAPGQRPSNLVLSQGKRQML